jgi:integrase
MARRREAGSPYGTIIRLMILTGQRRGEVAGMTWGELSADLASWTIPRERTKNGVVHVVPLSERARDLIRATLPKDVDAERIMRERRASNALVLPGAVGTVFSGWSKSKVALDKAINEAHAKAAAGAAAPLESWTVHDLRRTLATGLQRLDVRLEVTEAVLNHISGSRGGIAGVYQQHNWAAEKRTALDRWANYVWAACVLATPEKGTDAGNVLPFARAS